MKRTGGATLGTMVAWHLSTSKTEAAEEGEAGVSAGWWDMKCIQPTNFPSRSIRAINRIPFYAAFDLVLSTNLVADNGYYNTKDVEHDFALNMVIGSNTDSVSGKNAFSVDCNKISGVITSKLEPASSTPAAGASITKNFQAAGLYSVDLTIYIIRNQGAQDVQTKVFGVVAWHEILNPQIKGDFRIPEKPGSSIEVTNSFEARRN